MARVTVEDCIDKVESPYELVLVAKERATQLNSGIEPNVEESLEDEEEIGDDFENLYKGEISKSGVPILPSKRARKIPEKIKISDEDLAELKSNSEEVATPEPVDEEIKDNNSDVSLDEMKEQEKISEEHSDSDNS